MAPCLRDCIRNLQGIEARNDPDYAASIGRAIRDSKRAKLLPVAQAENYEVIMDFGDGYTWFNTHSHEVCDLTKDAGRSMRLTGHCSTCHGHDEKALVLREYIDDGDGYWRSVLHFCLDPDGYLRGMKGRKNSKPKEEYHKYIVSLLRDYEPIQGIQGGGHKPHTNFALADLKEEWQEMLADEKPGLAGHLRFPRRSWMRENPGKGKYKRKHGRRKMPSTESLAQWQTPTLPPPSNIWDYELRISNWLDRNNAPAQVDANTDTNRLRVISYKLPQIRYAFLRFLRELGLHDIQEGKTDSVYYIHVGDV